MVSFLVNNGHDFSLIVDESTSVSCRNGLILFIRMSIEGKYDNFFLNLVDLEDTTGVGIFNAVMDTFRLYNISDKFTIIGFVCRVMAPLP